MTGGLPPQYFVPNRESLLDLYKGFTKNGWFPSAETEVDFWIETLSSFGLTAVPVSGWEKLSLDIRLANLALSDGLNDTSLGRAALAKKLTALADKLDDIEAELTALSWNPDIIAVTLRDNNSYQKRLPEIHQFGLMLRTTSEALAQWKQKPRWREAHQRMRRMELAVLLSRVFVEHFGQAATPCGGSHFRPIEETNDWTRFYQAVAFAFWDERETPDRQAVLWEATRTEIIDYEPRVSDNPDALATKLSDSAGD